MTAKTQRTQRSATKRAGFGARLARRFPFALFASLRFIMLLTALQLIILNHQAHAGALHEAVTRVPWTTSRVIGYPDPPLPYVPVRVFPKLKVFQPLYLLQQPGSDLYLLLQHLGNRGGPA